METAEAGDEKKANRIIIFFVLLLILLFILVRVLTYKKEYHGILMVRS